MTTRNAPSRLVIGWSAYPWSAEPPFPPFERRGARPEELLFEKERWRDARSGVWTTSLGHAPAAVTRALRRAASKPANSALLGQDSARARALAERLLGSWGEARGAVSLGVTGSQVVDRGLQLALAVLERNGAARARIVSFRGAYHGEFGLAREASSAPGVHARLPRKGHTFLPAPRCQRCPVGKQPASCRAQCLDGLGTLVVRKERLVLVLEPVQISNGCLLPAPVFGARLQELQKQAGRRMIILADEVACGLHRAGPAFGQTLLGLRADLTTLGKALTSGLVPLSALLLSSGFVSRLRGGAPKEAAFGSTYDGYRIGVEAAHATLELMEASGLGNRVHGLQEALARGLAPLSGRVPIRTGGAIAIVEVPLSSARFEALLAALRKERLIVYSERPQVMLLPPLVSRPGDVERLAAEVATVVRRFLR